MSVMCRYMLNTMTLLCVCALITNCAALHRIQMMPKRKSKRDSHGDLGEKGEGEGVRYRSRTVMGLLKTKLRRSKNGGAMEEGEELSGKQKCATLPARMVPKEGGSVGKGGGGSGKNVEGSKTRTLYWMEEYLGPYQDTLSQSLTVSRKDSDESVDSGFEQTHKTEGSETDSNSSPAQSKALIPVGSLCHEASGSFQEEPRYQSVQSNSMYDEAAFDKAFGPMKDIGRWYSTYSSQKQLQQVRLETRDRGEGQDHLCEVQGAETAARPSARCVLEEHEQRLVSRPLPPIPRDPAREEEGSRGKQGAAVGGVSQQQRIQEQQLPPRGSAAAAADCSSRSAVSRTHEDMYELVEHRLRGNNPLMLGLRNVARYGWYWGPVTRVEAEEKLQGTDDGTFLVRDSSDERYLLSLSFRSQGKTLHTRIEYSNGFFSFYSFPDSDSEGYRSVVELIEWSMKHSQDGIFCFSRGKAIGSPAVPVRLLKPLSRFNQVRTLQHYCRFVIRQSIRFDCIRQLPLPRHVHGFLEQSQY